MAKMVLHMRQVASQPYVSNLSFASILEPMRSSGENCQNSCGKLKSFHKKKTLSFQPPSEMTPLGDHFRLLLARQSTYSKTENTCHCQFSIKLITILEGKLSISSTYPIKFDNKFKFNYFHVIVMVVSAQCEGENNNSFIITN